VSCGSRAADGPPLAAVAPEAVITALEALAPQARPYNFDDRFDCWGLVREVYDRLLPGRPLDDDLDTATADEAARVGRWAPITEMAELLPGDVVTTHDHHVPGEFHALIVYGHVAGRLLVYDSSPRGDVPLFEQRDGGYVFVRARELRTRYMRATGGTDRLRNDGGAYLRLWFMGGRYYDRRLHDALLEANPRHETDVVALRRRAGLAPLPFYLTRRLPTDRRRRELYDNLATRALTAYLPDGAPVPDDVYLQACAEGAAGGRRPAPPMLVAAPAAAHSGGPARLEWSYLPQSGDLAALGCRVEVHELRSGVWKHPVLAHDCDEPQRSFTIPADALRPDMCYEVSLFARAAAGCSPDIVATFVNEPDDDNPFLAPSMVRPFGLSPDAGEVVTTATPELRWSIFDAPARQAAVRLAVHAGGCAESGPLVHEATLEGEAAAGTAYAVPAAAGLEPGTTYHWYLTPRDRDGRWAFAPVEGVFTVAPDAGSAGDSGRARADHPGEKPGVPPKKPGVPPKKPGVPPKKPSGRPGRDPRFRPRAGGI